MSMSDPISDMLTRIRNAQMAEIDGGDAFFKVKAAIAKVLWTKAIWKISRSLTMMARPHWKSASSIMQVAL